MATRGRPGTGGKAAKDKVIVDGFNHKKKTPKFAPLEDRQLKKAMRIVAKASKPITDLEKSIAEAKLLQKQVDKETEAAEKAFAAAALRVELANEVSPAEIPTSPNSPDDANDAKSAYQMLQDMRWVYRNVRGRKKLKDMVDSDDKQFLFMVKELMKIETSLLSAKIRTKEDNTVGGQQTVFVVLKGLDSPMQKVVDVSVPVDDRRYIERAQRMINPDMELRAEEVELDDRGAPELLLGRLNSEEAKPDAEEDWLG